MLRCPAMRTLIRRQHGNLSHHTFHLTRGGHCSHNKHNNTKHPFHRPWLSPSVSTEQDYPRGRPHNRNKSQQVGFVVWILSCS